MLALHVPTILFRPLVVSVTCAQHIPTTVHAVPCACRQCRGLEQDVAAAAQVLQGALPHTLNQQQQRLAALDLPLDWEGSSDPQSTLQQQQQQQQAAPWAVQAGRQYILQLQGTVSQVRWCSAGMFDCSLVSVYHQCGVGLYICKRPAQLCLPPDRAMCTE
jgi:hypothetical protein